MKILSATQTRPEDIMRKRAFGRLLPSDVLKEGAAAGKVTGDLEGVIATPDPLRWLVVPQSDYLREFSVSSHRINSDKWYANPFLGKQGDENKGQRIYAKLRARTAIGFQSRIHTKRVTALVGDNVSHRLIHTRQGSEDMLSRFLEGWEEKDMETEVYGAISSDGKTGDAAVCLWLSGGKAGARVFSYDRGDTLYPHYDPRTGELALFGRLYESDEDDKDGAVEYLDVWDNTMYARWRKSGANGAVWEIDIEPEPHGFMECPVAYHRYGEPFWEQSQPMIDQYELALSQFAENNASYALRILYAFGGDMDVSFSIDGTPMQINSEDANAKVGFLEPAEGADGSFVKQLELLEKNIMKTSFAVETPEITGSDISSLTVKMMFADTYLKALQDALEYQGFLTRLTRLFKFAYGTEQGQVTEFTRLALKSELVPYIFMSETETVNSLVQLCGSGILSKRTASEIAYKSGYGTAAEWERVQNEVRDEYIGANTAQNTAQPNVVSQLRNANNGQQQ